MIGAIEAGGTKFVLAIGDRDGNILTRKEIPTLSPTETINSIEAFFKDKEVEAIGLACFGPLDLNKDSKTYGYITSTPKKGWENYDILGVLKKRLNVSIAFDTDVNGACLGEVYFGAAKNYRSALYLTIGTGIGAGVYIDGKLVHGLVHPEAGHIILKPMEGDDFKGVCPYHDYCFEGIASGPALEKRAGKKGVEIDKNDEVLKIEAHYIGQAIMNYLYVLSPEIIILGGGVMHQEALLPLIKEEVLKLNNGYIKSSLLTKENIDSYIVKPKLKDNAGICGGIALALELLNK